MGVAKNKSLKSANTNRAPLEALEMMLLTNILVSNMFAAGDPVSAVYNKRLPPIVIRTRYGLLLSGQ